MENRGKARRNLCCLFITVILMATSSSFAEGAMQPTHKNIALGKPYTMNRSPDYSATADPDDKTQLTDGMSFGSDWSLKTTVGWIRARRPPRKVAVTVDLGTVEPIRGVSLASAAGYGMVEWPSAILILVSDDGKEWHSLGDLTILSAIHGVPPETGKAGHRYWTDRFKAHGRYVQFLVRLSGLFFFADKCP